MLVTRKSQKDIRKTMLVMILKPVKKFREMDHIIDNETESLVIHLSDNNDSNGIEKELV